MPVRGRAIPRQEKVCSGFGKNAKIFSKKFKKDIDKLALIGYNIARDKEIEKNKKSQSGTHRRPEVGPRKYFRNAGHENGGEKVKQGNCKALKGNCNQSFSKDMGRNFRWRTVTAKKQRRDPTNKQFILMVKRLWVR